MLSLPFVQHLIHPKAVFLRVGMAIVITALEILYVNTSSRRFVCLFGFSLL